ncbi:hypothetical protein F5Y16DRAFT_368149 [Xylariaceae sp. FL0255]|nr:hypothetical protein F5Y16DRAFT_368149 [Xylariaceae sp. FL0255]
MTFDVFVSGINKGRHTLGFVLLHLDLVVANAGGSPISTIPLEKVSFEEMTAFYQANAVGPLMLFQACRSLLQKSRPPKWASISTGCGPVYLIGLILSWDGSLYAAANVSLNWITR